jgi:hypothetical protein
VKLFAYGALVLRVSIILASCFPTIHFQPVTFQSSDDASSNESLPNEGNLRFKGFVEKFFG